MNYTETTQRSEPEVDVGWYGGDHFHGTSGCHLSVVIFLRDWTVILLTYLLTAWSRILLKKLTGSQLVKKFSTFYGTQRIITAFTSARHLSLSWSHFLNIHINIIVPSTPGSPKWYLSLRFPHHNPVYASLLPHTRYMSPPSHSSRFYHPNYWVRSTDR